MPARKRSKSKNNGSSMGKKRSFGKSKWPFPHGLYPSVAASDFFCSVSHAYASFMLISYPGLKLAGLGFLLVSLASFVGTLRFGFTEDLAGLNGDFANLAGFVGLPCVGCSVLIHGGFTPPFGNEELIMMFVVLYSLSHSLSTRTKDLGTILLNILCFVLPLCYDSYVNGNINEFIGLFLFVIGAVFVGPEREKFLCGVRCENWFHYFIGVSAVIISRELSQATRLL
jgi:hypothetical protein